MAYLINLRQARKAKQRDAAAAKAAANRVAFGRSKTQKLAADIEAMRQSRALDGAKRGD